MALFYLENPTLGCHQTTNLLPTNLLNYLLRNIYRLTRYLLGLLKTFHSDALQNLLIVFNTFFSSCIYHCVYNTEMLKNKSGISIAKEVVSHNLGAFLNSFLFW